MATFLASLSPLERRILLEAKTEDEQRRRAAAGTSFTVVAHGRTLHDVSFAIIRTRLFGQFN